MHQYSRLLLMMLCTLLLISCDTPEVPQSGRAPGNLFAPSQADSALFQNVIDSTKILLSPDMAFAHSDLVVTARMISIDSMVHNKERAPYYLITVLPDSCLKGQTTLTHQRLYFISYRLLSMNSRRGGIICFLKGIKEKKLMLGTGIVWQWLDMAPANSSLADLTIPKVVHIFRRPHLHHPKKRSYRRVAQ